MGKKMTNYWKRTIAAVIATGVMALGGSTVFAEGGVAIDEAHFLDAGFRSYVAQNFDKDENGKLDEAELQEVTIISCGGNKKERSKIASLQGVEYFENLSSLYCQCSQIAELDVSKNGKLLAIWCQDNQLTGIDVSMLSELTILECSDNQIDSLDVSANQKLVYLMCNNNHLKKLDVRKNTVLTDLECAGNQLKELNVRRNEDLKRLFCNGNEISTLDISKNQHVLKALANGKDDYYSAPEGAVRYSYSGSGWDNTFIFVVDDTVELVTEDMGIPCAEMYRLYNPNSGEHFYTASVAERDYLDSVGWNYEGLAWKAPENSNTPVYRLYNPNAGDHHYTTSAAERDMLVSLGWNDEGIGWYSDDEEGEPLYRLYNPNATQAGAHHYTTNAAERDYLVSIGWNDEGIGWYGGK